MSEPPSMNCREFTEFILAWMEGELPEDQARVFTAHVERCPPCGRYLDSYRKTVELGRRCTGDDPTPEDVPEELVAAILAARRGAGGPGAGGPAGER